ncbi:MAG TPA: M20/M25/M40 family metallo-hydrolase [Gemmatimonadaceae bacterium]|jgi:acetylornithine deacetylase/succinyl-diaminopimelate desuccinylase-like protein
MKIRHPLSAIRHPLLAIAVLASPLSAQTLREQVRTWREAREPQIVREYAEFLAIPNTKNDGEALRRNATAIVGMLARRGVAARLLENGNWPPAVYGELRAPGATRTIVVYAHYDGQPVDPTEWKGGAPYAAQLRELRGGEWVDVPLPERGRLNPEARIFARGAGDDKAPINAILNSLDALRALGKSPTINVKFFFEGEEESGSAHLPQILAANKALLAADAWLFCDGPTHQSRGMQVAFGARGAMGLELTVYGPAKALHSGHYGNWAPNPGMLLADLARSMRDIDGRILIKGYYDDVVPPTARELAAVRALPPVDSALRRELLLGGTEADNALLAERILLPAINMRGLRVGQVEGLAANAIATEAKASFDFRLVPKQTPAHVRELVEAHLKANGWYVTHAAATDAERLGHRKVVRMTWGEGDEATRVSLDQPVSQALTATLDEMLGKPVLRVPTLGGSLPTSMIEHALGVPLVIFPIANHDDNQHAKDENLRLQNLWDGIEAFAAIMTRLDAHWPKLTP